MILITSTVQIQPEHWDDAKSLAQEHVELSRREPGCISHNWFEHPEEARSLFFYEQWQDQEAIDSHFKASYSQHLARRFAEWASSPPVLRIMPVAGVMEHKLG